MNADTFLINPTDESVGMYWKNNDPPTCSSTN